MGCSVLRRLSESRPPLAPQLLGLFPHQPSPPCLPRFLSSFFCYLTTHPRLLFSPAFLSLAALPNPRRASARARTNICQQNKSLTWHPGIFFSFAATWREYKGTKQSCACHVSASKETIISSWHEDAAFWLLHIARWFSYHKTKAVIAKLDCNRQKKMYENRKINTAISIQAPNFLYKVLSKVCPLTCVVYIQLLKVPSGFSFYICALWESLRSNQCVECSFFWFLS